MGRGGPSQAEAVIKTIIRQIVTRCQERGATFSQALVGFMVKAVVLDPKEEFSVERTLTQSDVDRLIDRCTNRLTEHDSPRLNTLQMQVYFDMNYTSRNEYIHEHRRVIQGRLLSAVTEIVDSRARSREELENLYRRIVTFILLQSGLGSATDMMVVRETTAALQSVFPAAELGQFLEFTRKEKERHLRELALIVSGIRLFNKKTGNGTSRGIEDLPSKLTEAIKPATDEINVEIEAAQLIASNYTAILKESEEEQQKYENHEKMMDALYNITQWEVFLRIIYNELIKASHQIATLNKKLAEKYEQIGSAVHTRHGAVPTKQIYPLFIGLADLWTLFQEEIVLLSVFQRILTESREYTKSQEKLFPKTFLEKVTAGLSLLNEENYVELAKASGRINPELCSTAKEATWIFPETLSHNMKLNQITFQFRQYCPYQIAENGLLIPGTPAIGILCHDDDFYVFSTVQAAENFSADIEGMIGKISKRARHSPELINLLQLQRQFQTLANSSQVQRKKQPRLQADFGTQTDIHIKEPYIDKDYEWNEWEMRKNAQKLANLRKCLTNSTQTTQSHFRRESETQVYLPKDQSTITKKDESTSVPRSEIYLSGLRGLKEPGSFMPVDITDYGGIKINK